MGTTLSPRTLDAVEALLPAEAPGLTPREVFALYRIGAKVSVSHALYQLVREGRVAHVGEMGHRRYHRVAA